MAEQILIENYNYHLPESSIAQHAAEPRDSSRLLKYVDGKTEDFRFKDLVNLLPGNSALFMNNAKVIPARIILKNSNGARIEVFLLQPYNSDHVTALNAVKSCEWECLIGNSKKWKADEILEIYAGNTRINIERSASNRVCFNWEDGQAFVHILEAFGKLPLPPYIHHEAGDNDLNRYQTVYAKVSGSVAAPTAGLHFTDEVFASLDKAGVKRHYLTLHVSAGTFLPVKVSDANEHIMHSEVFSAGTELIKALSETENVIAVGTTSCRVIESLYQLAVNLKAGLEKPFNIEQFSYRKTERLMSRKEAMTYLLRYMSDNNLTEINGSTSIMIAPGYRFMGIDGLITNFHQPGSTLLLLISAFIGDDWRGLYQDALDKGYRFLSYGDSSLLLPRKI